MRVQAVPSSPKTQKELPPPPRGTHTREARTGIRSSDPEHSGSLYGCPFATWAGRLPSAQVNFQTALRSYWGPWTWGLWTAALNPARPTEDSKCPHFGSPIAFHHCRDFPRPRTRMLPGGVLGFSSPCSLSLGKVLECPISGVLISFVSILVVLEFGPTSESAQGTLSLVLRIEPGSSTSKASALVFLPSLRWHLHVGSHQHKSPC